MICYFCEKPKILKATSIIFRLVAVIALAGCGVLQQTSEMSNFSRCEFRLASVKNMNLAGVNIQGAESLSDLGVMEYARISAAVASGALPLTFDLYVQARNPNEGKAAMNKLDWILLIDKVEVTRGVLDNRVEILPNSITTFPVAISFDLFKALAGESGGALLNFAFNLSGSGERPSQLTLKAKPAIYIGDRALQYPGYININQEFGAN